MTTRATSQALRRFGKGTAEKMSFLAENSQGGGSTKKRD